MKLDTESEEVRTQYGHEYYPTTITVDSLAEECSYQLPMQVWNIWDLMILDGKVLYYIPDEQTDELVPAAYDLQTGEEIILPSVFRNFDIFGETGQWFYGRVYETDESSEKVRILKSNFYAGNPVYIEVSEEW